MRRIFLPLAALFLLLIPSLPANACSCGSSPMDETYKNALTIFEGEVIDGMGSTDCGQKKMLMRVDKVYKGVPGKEVYVHTEDACVGCGKYLSKGAKYMVFARGSSLDDLQVGGCGATYDLRRETQTPRNPFIEERQQQLAAIDEAILAQPENGTVLLRTKAEHLLYWQDYQQAEVVLKQLMERKSADLWAMNELMGVLYRQRKAQQIWDFHESLTTQGDRSILGGGWDGPRNNTAFALSFASLSLGKDLGEKFSLRIEDTQLTGLSQSGRKFRFPRFKKVIIENSNFSGADLSRMRVEESRFSGVDFSGAVFNDADFRDVSAYNSPFSRADFTGARVSKSHFAGDFSGAVFKKAHITDVQFNGADFTGADFSGAIVSGGMFAGAKFKGANLTGITLDGVRYDCTTEWPDGFDPQAAGATQVKECRGERGGRNAVKIPGYPESLASKTLEGKDYSGQTLERETGQDAQYHWAGKNLKRANFTNASFSAPGFSYSDLSGARFDWALLQQASFSDAILNDANFSHAYLLNASFKGVKSDKTDFTGAHLDRANFSEAEITNAVFREAQMISGGFNETKMPDADFRDARLMGTTFLKSDFTGADFSGADLRGARLQRGDMNVNYTRYRNTAPLEKTLFKNAKFAKANLDGADLRGADFTGAKLTGASLLFAKYDCNTAWPDNFDAGSHGAVLSGSICEGKPVAVPQIGQAPLKQADLSGTTLGSINLSGKDLSRAKLDGADLSQANLAKTDLTMAVFDCDTKWPEGYDPLSAGATLGQTFDEKCFAKYGRPKLAGRDLSGMNLFTASFGKADLKGANLSGASMGRADLFGADLTGADLRDADLSMANLNGAVLKDAKINCNTDFPRGFDAAAQGAKDAGGDCQPRTNKNDPSRVAVQMLVHDWRKPPAVKGISVKNEDMSWFRPPGREGLEDAVFENVKMRRALLGHVQIKSSKFINSELTRVFFKKTILADVDFSGSILKDADFSDARLKNVNFSKADIRGAYFSQTDFENVNWEGVIYDCTTKGAPLPLKPCN